MAKPLHINEFILSNDADITSLCETWIKPGDDPKIKEMCPKNHTFHGKSRNSRGGGVGVVVKDTIRLKQDKTQHHFSSFEHHSVIVTLAEKRLKLVTIYRPPSDSTIKDFLIEFEDLVANVSTFNGSILLAGDFNLHFNKPDSTEVGRFIDILDSFGLQQHVNETTHKFGNIIDFVITRADDDIIKSINVLPRLDKISDHHPISCTLRAARAGNRSGSTIKKRLWRNLDTAAFAHDIAKGLNSLSICDQTNVNMLDSTYKACATAALNQHAPLVDRRTTRHRHHPWYNDDIHLLRQTRRRLERKWRKSKSDADWKTYETHCQLVIQTIQSAKQSYYREKLAASPQDAHRVINDLLRVEDKQLPSCDSDTNLADKFVDFFQDKVKKIRTQIDDTIIESCIDIMPPCPHSFVSFTPITEGELKKVINKAKTKSCKLDPIPTHILKEDAVLDILIPFLTKMVNSSLISGVMPDGMKTALIIPHLKKPSLDPDVFSNYRPVSNVQFLGKIIEKCVASQLCQHLSHYQLGDKLQSAYKPAHSTETALVRVKRDCDQAIDSGKAVLLVLLDLSAAFDTIDHSILLERLNRYVGVGGSVHKWFDSYLSNRSQQVIINNKISKHVTLDMGVPQGSVLGPLLFLIYILPLQHLITKHGITHHGYADDTQLYIEFNPKTADGLSNAIIALENCVNDIRKWMVTNKLKLNDDKTEFQVIASTHHLRRLIDLNPTIKIANAQIHPSKTVRNLGVTFDSNLAMNEHLKSISRSMYYHMRGIRHVRHYLDHHTCTKAVISLVISRLDYANAVLAGLSDSALQRLQVAQNSAARLITGTPKHEHISPILQHLHWLPVSKRIIFKSLCIVYKCLNQQNMPEYLTELFVRHVPSRTLRSSSAENRLTVNRTKTKYGDRKFDTWTAKMWNTLPPALQEAPTILAFKRQLKTRLFKEHYNL
jgi:hypothetical protein